MRYTRLFKGLSVWLLVMTLGLSAAAAYADGPDKDKDKDKDKQRQEAREAARKAAGPSCTPGSAVADLDANNVRARLYNNGQLFYPDAIYEVPKGSGAHALFASGIWIGGRVDGELRMAAATYAQGGSDYEFFPGPLEETVATGNCDPYDRLWKVNRSDVDALDRGEAPTQDIAEWPWDLGAPVLDGDGDPNNYNLAGGDRPEVLGDQTIWWIMNDAAGPHLTTLAPAINLEVQATAFSFNTADALNNTTFYKFKLIYKGDAPLTETFMGLWSDPDLGCYTNDFVGSDTTLGLGFVYNGTPTDPNCGVVGYGNNPPALGYDFFQGPLVDNDGIDNNGSGEVDEEGERLQMTRFVYYNNDGSDQGNPGDAEDHYGYLRGRWKDGSRMTIGGDGFGDDLGLGPTNFMFTGEPPGFWSEDNTDGSGTRNTPADRRFLMSTGPWTMQPGEEQEIVFGIVWSQTANRIGSVKKLKADDILAQGAFDFNFQLPPAPDAPMLEATELDGEIVLSWNNLPTSNNYLNQYDSPSPFLVDPNASDTTYTFEGYKVYQYASPADFPNNGELIATVDVANEVTTVTDEAIDPTTGAPILEISAQGTDSGVQNYLVIQEDEITDQPLRNYTEYYYGVQAYAYNAFSNPKIYQSPIVGDPGGEGPLRVVPSRTTAREGGTVLNAATNDQIQAQINKLSDAIITATVSDPTAVTGDNYEVRFYRSDETGALIYDVVNASTGTTIISGRDLEAQGKVPPMGQNAFIHDGLSFTIVDAPAGFAGNGAGIVEVAHPAGDPCAGGAGGCATYGGDTVWRGLNSTADYYVTAGNGSDLGPGGLGRFIEFAAPRDFEMRFTDEGGYCVYAFTDDMIASVPFEIWDIGIGTPDDPSDDKRMIPFCNNNAETSAEWQFASGTDPWAAYPMSDWVYWMDPEPDTDGYAAFAECAEQSGGPGATYNFELCDTSTDGYYANFYGGFVYPIGRFAFGDFAEDGTPPPSGTVIRVITTKPIAAGDVFTLNTSDIAPVRQNAEVAEEALDAIGVVPNPYRGASAYDQTVFQNEVRFTNLPQRATIRIFSLNGTLIRQLEKSSPDPMFTWDLRSEDGLPVSSGIYLIHFEVPDVGERVVKFGVVQKRIQLDVF